MTENSGSEVREEAQTQEAPAPDAPSDDRMQEATEPHPDDEREAELAQLRDVALRARADLDNALKRHRRELENAHKYGAEKLAAVLLPVLDSLERASTVEGGGDPETLVEQLLEGNRLTLNLFQKALADADIAVVDPLGEPFDPALHQAITMQPTDQVAPNHVVEVMQKGYRLHDRLVRPAMVVVAQAPPKGAAPETGSGEVPG